MMIQMTQFEDMVNQTGIFGKKTRMEVKVGHWSLKTTIKEYLKSLRQRKSIKK